MLHFENSLTLLLLFKDCLNCLKSENIGSSVDQFYIDSLPISRDIVYYATGMQSSKLTYDTMLVEVQNYNYVTI